MTTKIEVQEYNGTKLEVTYTIDQKITGSRVIVKRNFGKGQTDESYFSDSELMDELTLKGVVLNLTNKIHIFSIAPADEPLFKETFEKKHKELPMCIEFTIEPGVNLKIPAINNQDYQEDLCPICLDPLYTLESLEKGGPVVGIAFRGCGHKYHRDCLEMYFKTLKGKKTCPTCKNSMVYYFSLKINDVDDGKTKKGGRTKRRKKTRKSR